MKRGKLTISLSPRNPDAITVGEALKEIPARQRSAELLRWAAAYLAGEQRALTQPDVSTGFSEEEIADIDAALDNF